MFFKSLLSLIANKKHQLERYATMAVAHAINVYAIPSCIIFSFHLNISFEFSLFALLLLLLFRVHTQINELVT